MSSFLNSSTKMAAPTSRSVFILLVLLLLMTFSEVAQNLAFTAIREQAYGRSNLRPSDCKPKCNYRCSATSHKKPCMFFCQKCCAKCLCVPAGTYGNKQSCPCYNNWKTQEGGPKCP